MKTYMKFLTVIAFVAVTSLGSVKTRAHGNPHGIVQIKLSSTYHYAAYAQLDGGELWNYLEKTNFNGHDIYFAGHFTGVQLFDENWQALVSIGEVYNVVRMTYNQSQQTITLTKLNVGYYGGAGNGINSGTAKTLALSSAGDLYVGGSFSSAGGFPYSNNNVSAG
jgi:hypothetical protein